MTEYENQTAAPQNGSAAADGAAAPQNAPNPTDTAPAGPPPCPPPQPQKVRRVGTVAFGLTLVLAGVLLIADLFLPDLSLLRLARFAPVILVVLGVEVLVYAARPGVIIKYDFLSMFATALILVVVGGASLVPLAVQYLGPEVDGTRERLYRQLESDTYRALSAAPALDGVVHDASFSIELERVLKPDGTLAWDTESAANSVYFTLNQNYGSEAEFAADCQAILAACRAAQLPIQQYRFDTWVGGQSALPAPRYQLDLNGLWMASAGTEVLTADVSTDWYYQGSYFGDRASLDAYLQEQAAATAETAQQGASFVIEGHTIETEEEMQAYLAARDEEQYNLGYQDGFSQARE